jgi:hypothetical protein
VAATVRNMVAGVIASNLGVQTTFIAHGLVGIAAVRRWG